MLFLKACLAFLLARVNAAEVKEGRGTIKDVKGRAEALREIRKRINERKHAHHAVPEKEYAVAEKFRSDAENTSFNMEQCSSVVGSSCWWDSHCCGDLQCLGVINWECGNSPGHEGEYCNLYYPCRGDLVCHEGICEDYKNVLRWGVSGTCKSGSPAGQIKVMSYNLFVLDCDFYPLDALGLVPCQHETDYRPRIEKLLEWVKGQDEDVIMVQEMFNLHDEIIAGMAEAGFCHHVASAFGQDGDGKAIFSKYPITAVDFLDWNDAGDPGKISGAECLFSDKGIMYARVEKDGTDYHVFNTHTMSNSVDEEHPNRMVQYLTIREFVREVVGETSNGMVLLGGDFNENKFIEENYLAMLQELDATDPELEGDAVYTYDTINNPLPDSFQDADWQERLDYVLVSNTGLQPTASSCRILTPSLPAGCHDITCMLSDHFPVTCTFGDQPEEKTERRKL